MPAALRRAARWQRLGAAGIPALLAHPSWDGPVALPDSSDAPDHPAPSTPPVPVVIWLHGRTVTKELDPGRYLRWLRAGIGTCALDLPGHGERFDPELQTAERTFDVIRQAIDEIDLVVAALGELRSFDLDRVAIGGVSAGGMAALARLCRPHRFRCASVEATTGSWRHQRERAMFRNVPDHEIDALNPIEHLDGWREIPLQAFHSVTDQWVAFEGQAAFIEALRQKYQRPEQIELVTYENTGAAQEHVGFGRFAADAKDRQRDFLARWLEPVPQPPLRRSESQ
jgi:pimeloyl-ACP methyl ester carboxylesterase